MNVRDVYGYVPLHITIRKKYFECAQVLLSHGANVNFKKSDGSTALHMACESVRKIHHRITYLMFLGRS